MFHVLSPLRSVMALLTPPVISFGTLDRHPRILACCYEITSLYHSLAVFGHGIICLDNFTPATDHEAQFRTHADT